MASATPDPQPRRAPVPPGWPLLGLAVPMRRDPLGTMKRAFADTGNGDAIHLKLGPYRATLFRNPEHIKRIFVDNAANYSKRTRGYLKAKLVLGEGLVTSEGELWQRQRRIAGPAFHRNRISGFAQTMVAATDEMLRTFPGSRDPAKGAGAGPAETRDLFSDMMRLTLRIAVETLMGVGPSDALDRVSRAVTEVLERTNDIITNPASLPLWMPLPKYRRFRSALAVLDGFVYQTIAARRATSGESTDLLSMLLAARDEQTGEGMTDLQLRDEAVTILIAGHETTANALTWAFWLLGTHPPTLERIRQEIDSVLGGRAPGYEDWPNLRYTRAVIDETMRLYPPAWMIGRYAIESDVIGPYFVKKGQFVLVSPYMTHRSPAIWDQPDVFDPTRFIDGRADALPKFSYLPFGGGMRFCIGANFALMEATLLLARILQQVTVAPDGDFVPDPYAMITLRPRHGLRMRVLPR